MAWDASRPVPWERLTREWLIYVAIMAALFLLLFRDSNLIGVFAGLLISGPLYLAFGFVLAKFGYRRKSLKELRSESATTRSEPERPAGPKPKPAPTKRTGGGGGRPGGSRRRRR